MYFLKIYWYDFSKILVDAGKFFIINKYTANKKVKEEFFVSVEMALPNVLNKYDLFSVSVTGP